MPTPTYDVIAATTLAASTPSVVFSSIPQNYRDLVLVIEIQGLGGNPASRNASVFLNGVRGTQVWMYGAAGAQVGGQEFADVTFPFGNYRNYGIANIMDYSATDKEKIILTRAGSPVNVEWAMAGKTPLTAAVTSIELLSPDSGSDTWVSGNTFVLYGIAG